jgi:hypothetical protein
MSKKKRIFAIYLPQFHPIPENDLFWGKGFTEWHNVTSTSPLFPGHHQPQLPTELGFYDLRVPETMEQQAILAHEHGIDGFLFYHYCFNGKPVMDKPLQNYLNLKQNKLPYYFCWANENWTRRWDGGETDILLQQNYNDDDAIRHLEYLLQYFRDDNYVKINNCPVLVVYKPFLIPDLMRWVKVVREFCRSNSFDGIYLIYMIHQGTEPDVNVVEKGFDAGLVFEPSWKDLDATIHKLNIFDKAGKLAYLLKLRKNLPLIYRHNRMDYNKYIEYRMRNKVIYDFKCFPSVFPSWDNSCRRKKGGGNIFVNSDPLNFKRWFKHTLVNFKAYSDEENFLIINAWNEWAEGNHLEPCNKWGRQYLEAVKDVIGEHTS